MRRLYILIAAFIVLLAAIFATVTFFAPKQSTPSHKTAQANYSNVTIGVEASSNGQAMAFAYDNGVRYFREDIRLTPQEMANISQLSSDGAQVVGILDYDTLGVQISNGRCIAECNWSLNDWNATVYNAIESYPEVHIWEIWNEPLVGTFQSGFENGSPYNYYLMLRSAYDLIKQHNSSDTVLCLGGDGIYSSNSTNAIGLEWAAQLWSYGAAEYCNAISLHVYPGALPSQTVSGQYDIAHLINQSLEEYSNLTGKPIWITEFGIPSNINQNDGLQLQSEFLNQSMGIFLSKRYISGVIWYNLEGYSGSSDYGLLNATTLTPKPSWYALVRFINNKSVAT